MKKIFFLAAMALMSLAASAQQKIAYILPEGCSYENSQLSGFPEEQTGQEAMAVQTPELNAAQWFKENYVDKGIGEFLPVGDVTSADLSKYELIWVHVERISYPDQTQLIDHYGFSQQVVDALKKYAQETGNLYLSKMAVSLAWSMDRIGYQPNCENAGAYELKAADDWFCTQPLLGCNLTPDQQVNNSDLSVFTGLEKSDNSEYWHNAFKMTNAEVREANLRCCFNDYFTWDETEKKYVKNPDDNGQKALLTGWENEWNAQGWTCLGNIGDYCYADIVYFCDGENRGYTWKEIICNGATSCQWTKCNDGKVPAPVTTLTANILDFLAPQATGINEVSGSSKVVSDCSKVFNVAGQQVSASQKGLVIESGKKIVK